MKYILIAMVALLSSCNYSLPMIYPFENEIVVDDDLLEGPSSILPLDPPKGANGISDI